MGDIGQGEHRRSGYFEKGAGAAGKLNYWTTFLVESQARSDKLARRQDELQPRQTSVVSSTHPSGGRWRSDAARAAMGF